MRKTRACMITAAWVLAGLPLIARASTADELVTQLSSNDEKTRAYARHMLPHQGVDVVERIIPLAAQENEAVWRAAIDVLWDFANETSVPGREPERLVVASNLMKLIAPDQPEQVKIRGLRLLALAVPGGYDIRAIAALLDDPQLAEKARATLQDMRTPEGCRALREYLPKAKPAFQCAILDSLGFLRDADSLDVIKDLTRSGSTSVRAAASRALAWTGDPANLAIAKAVVERADDATRAEATDALLRLVETMAAAGTHRQTAIDTWLEMLRKAEGVAKDAALAGLGRYGDGPCVKAVIAAIKDAPVATQRIGLQALAVMPGREVSRELASVYPDAPGALKPGLVRAMGLKQDALVSPILIEAARSNEPALRLAALDVFGDAGLPAGVAILGEAARTGDEQEKTIAQTALLRLAHALQDRGQKADAGAAYAGALATMKDVDARRQALSGIAACPTVGACDAVIAAANEPALAEQALPALVAVGRTLTAEKEKTKAVAVFDRVWPLHPPLPLAQAVLTCLGDLGEKTDPGPRLGFITRWQAIGPFELGEQNKGWDVDYISEPKFDPKAECKTGDKKLTWKAIVSQDPMGKIDLRKTIADRDFAIAYVYAQVNVAKDTDAVLRIGVDDSEKVWVNGQKVYEQFVPRGLTVDADRIAIKLKAGTNAILMKIWQNVMGWEFCARLTTPDDRALAFTQD